jgi:hypothetical protein
MLAGRGNPIFEFVANRQRSAKTNARGDSEQPGSM